MNTTIEAEHKKRIEVVRYPGTDLKQVYVSRTDPVSYSLRDKTYPFSQDPRHTYQVVPTNIHEGILVKADGVGESGGRGNLDAKDLKRKCPKNCNAFFQGDSIRSVFAPNVLIIDGLMGREYPAGLEKEVTSEFGIVNFCNVSGFD